MTAPRGLWRISAPSRLGLRLRPASHLDALSWLDLEDLRHESHDFLFSKLHSTWNFCDFQSRLEPVFRENNLLMLMTRAYLTTRSIMMNDRVSKYYIMIMNILLKVPLSSVWILFMIYSYLWCSYSYTTHHEYQDNLIPASVTEKFWNVV